MATTAIVRHTVRFSVTETPPDRQSSNDGGSLEEYLRGVCKQWERVARPGRVGRWYIWSQNEMFYRGMQLYTFDALEGEWEEWPEDLQDLYHAINLVLPFVEMNTSEYTKSKPKLIIYSEAGDDGRSLRRCRRRNIWPIAFKRDCGSRKPSNARQRLFSFEVLSSLRSIATR